jgi:hypothetical protein
LSWEDGSGIVTLLDAFYNVLEGELGEMANDVEE